MAYTEPPLTATEIEHRLRRYLDELVALAGGPLTVFRVASLLTVELRAKIHTNDERPLAAFPEAEAVIEAVANAHGVPVPVLRGRDRSRPVALARHHATWELRRRRPDIGLCKIATWLDRSDHSTVINSLRRFNAAVAQGQHAAEIALVEDTLACR